MSPKYNRTEPKTTQTYHTPNHAGVSTYTDPSSQVPRTSVTSPNTDLAPLTPTQLEQLFQIAANRTISEVVQVIQSFKEF